MSSTLKEEITPILPQGNFRLVKGSIRSRAGDVAPEAVHVHCERGERCFSQTLKNPLTLFRTTVHGMDPMPATDTAALGARRHVLGDLERCVDRPDTAVVNAENDQILRLYGVYIRSVRDGESATLQVIDTLKGKKLAVPDGTSEVTRTHIG